MPELDDKFVQAATKKGLLSLDQIQECILLQKELAEKHNIRQDLSEVVKAKGFLNDRQIKKGRSLDRPIH